jgi:hypothetical protein
MTPGARWLDTLWALIRARLPAALARVVESTDDAHYQPIEFERAVPPHQVDAVIASTSLHHVADPAVRAKLPLDLVDRSSAGRSARRSRVRVPSLRPLPHL